VKTLALIAQKGGAGKTTIAVNLAVAAAEVQVALFDLDPQESAVIWSDRGCKPKPPKILSSHWTMVF
jgi:chromosome partitioning protein